MYTQCPKCHSIFTVSELQLTAREGLVRCGHCLEVFNAAWNLVDALPDTTEPTKPEGSAAQPPAPAAGSTGRREPRLPAAPELAPGDKVPADERDQGDERWNWGLTPAASAPRRPKPVAPAPAAPPPVPPENEEEVAPPPAPRHPSEWEPDEEIVLEAPQINWEAEAEPHLEPPMEPPVLEPARPQPATAPSTEMPPAPPPSAPKQVAPRQRPATLPERRTEIRTVDMPAPAARSEEDETPPAPRRRRRAPSASPATPPQHRRRVLPWYLGSLALLALLVIQTTFFYFDSLARMPAVRPQLETLCRFTGCSVPPLEDINQIDLVETRVVPHPRIMNALRVTATLVNRASFVQPFPLLEVSLTNRHGQTVARRTYTPAEYLGGKNAAQRRMPTNAATKIVLDITNPDRTAMGYEVQIVQPYPKPQPHLGELFARLKIGANLSTLVDKIAHAVK